MRAAVMYGAGDVRVEDRLEETGSGVRSVQAGDLVVTPFTYCDNTCDLCRKGLQSSCRHGGRYGLDGVDWPTGPSSSSPCARTPRCCRRC